MAGEKSSQASLQAERMIAQMRAPFAVLEPEARKGFNPVTVDKHKVKNHRRAKLLKRIFKIDVGMCPKCGTDLEIRAAVNDPGEIKRYLLHVGLSEHPPPIARARHERCELGLSFDDGPSPQDEIQISPDYL
jgi:hypothetical protein